MNHSKQGKRRGSCARVVVLVAALTTVALARWPRAAWADAAAGSGSTARAHRRDRGGQCGAGRGGRHGRSPGPVVERRVWPRLAGQWPSDGRRHALSRGLVDQAVPGAGGDETGRAGPRAPGRSRARSDPGDRGEESLGAFAPRCAWRTCSSTPRASTRCASTRSSTVTRVSSAACARCWRSIRARGCRAGGRARAFPIRSPATPWWRRSSKRSAAWATNGFSPSRCFAPLGVSGAALGWSDAVRARLAVGYQHGRPAEQVLLLHRPAGNLMISAAGLGRLLALQLGRGQIDGRRFLSAASIDRIERCETLPLAPPAICYGLGNWGDVSGPIPMRGHGGFIPGYQGFLRYSRQPRLRLRGFDQQLVVRERAGRHRPHDVPPPDGRRVSRQRRRAPPIPARISTSTPATTTWARPAWNSCATRPTSTPGWSSRTRAGSCTRSFPAAAAAFP